jgi:uncharacterized protein
MENENVELVRRGLEAMNRRDFDAVMALVDPEVVAHIPVEMANEGTYRGRDEFRTMMETWLEPWDEYRAEPHEFIARGDAVVVPLRQSARGKGSGVEVEMEAAFVMTARGGRLVAWRLYADPAEALASVEGESRRGDSNP